MKIKTGVDIIEIERVKKCIEETEGKFCERVYTEKEIEYCESKKTQKYQHYAARFAAKEAVFKAISVMIPDKYGINWKDIEILNDDTGKPYVNILNHDIKSEDVDVIISHCREYAVANAIFTIRDTH